MANIVFPTDTTLVTPAAGDLLLIADASDSNKAKEITISSLNSLLGKLKVTIPGEQVLDASNYQGMFFYNDTGSTITISNVAIRVGVAAAGAGAACAVNIYKSSGTDADGINTNAVNLFTSAIDLTTTYASLTNAPNTATVESGRTVSLRVTASAGATNKASDLQAIITYS